jgi:peptidoglycan-associated lipoprotein
MRQPPSEMIVALFAFIPVVSCARTPLPAAKDELRPATPAVQSQPPKQPAVPLPGQPGPVLPPAPVSRVSVFFDFDSYVLRPDAGPLLQQVATTAKNGGRPVKIEGHCDERGTPEYNMALGESRGRSAQRYLEALGIPRDKIAVVSFGSLRPRAKGQDEASWAQNRRGDVIVQ